MLDPPVGNELSSHGGDEDLKLFVSQVNIFPPIFSSWVIKLNKTCLKQVSWPWTGKSFAQQIIKEKIHEKSKLTFGAKHWEPICLQNYICKKMSCSEYCSFRNEKIYYPIPGSIKIMTRRIKRPSLIYLTQHWKILYPPPSQWLALFKIAQNHYW
jgi:hypothetical protein